MTWTKGDAELFRCHWLGNLLFEDLLWWNLMVIQRTLTLQPSANFSSEEQCLWDLLNQGTVDVKSYLDWVPLIEAVWYATAITDCLWAML
jgi:hypothetical protein